MGGLQKVILVLRLLTNACQHQGHASQHQGHTFLQTPRSGVDKRLSTLGWTLYAGTRLFSFQRYELQRRNQPSLSRVRTKTMVSGVDKRLSTPEWGVCKNLILVLRRMSLELA